MTDPTQNTPPDTAGLVLTFCTQAEYAEYIAAIRKEAADALEAATARADKAEARLAEAEMQRDQASDQADEWCKIARAALSRVTEAKAALRYMVNHAEQMERKEGIYWEATNIARAALAQSGGADPAQGGAE